jgi:hypothetical protein
MAAPWGDACASPATRATRARARFAREMMEKLRAHRSRDAGATRRAIEGAARSRRFARRSRLGRGLDF